MLNTPQGYNTIWIYVPTLQRDLITATMKSSFFAFFAAMLMAAVHGFTAAPIAGNQGSSALGMSKKNPQGTIYTGQEDEDAAMWIEDKKTGKEVKALKGPVGGRPINKMTKEMLSKKQGKQPAASGDKPWWKLF